MTDTESVATLIDFTTSKIQQLQQAFAELESQSAVSLNLKWKELEEHFHGLEKSLKRRFDDLEDQEKEYVTKESKTQDVLEKREAEVVAIEEASLDRLQEKRDVALSTIFRKHKSHPSEPARNSMCNSIPDSIAEEKPDVIAAKLETEDVTSFENSNEDASPCSQLYKLCEEMDAKGLHQFISDNRKNLVSLREEIPAALRSAIDPFSLVLDSLKDFHTEGLDGKKDANLLGLRRTCLMLMECLSQLLADGISGSSDKEMLASDIKERAKVIASEWQSKLGNLYIEAGSGNSLEAHALLQLLATFGISSEFDENEICKLIPAVSRRRQTAHLCRSLGWSERIPGVIDMLVNSGRQIEAVNLAYAFELTEQYAPVPLLKAYLKEARKVTQVKAGNMSPGAQNEMNERELSAFKAVIKCVEDHKLESEYPVDTLQKRILQLEKAKADKRREIETGKPQSKRPRASGGTCAPRVTGCPDKSFYRTPERYPYSYDKQYVYSAETHPLPALGSAPYTISPTHTTTYYGGGYQVQYVIPYLH